MTVRLVKGVRMLGGTSRVGVVCVVVDMWSANELFLKSLVSAIEVTDEL